MTEQNITNQNPFTKRRIIAVALSIVAIALLAVGSFTYTDASWSGRETAGSSFQVGVYNLEARTPNSNIPVFAPLDGRTVELRRLTTGHWASGDTRTETLGIKHASNSNYPSIIPAKPGYMDISVSGNSSLRTSLRWELYNLHGTLRNPTECTKAGAANTIRQSNNAVLIASGKDLNSIEYHNDIIIGDSNNTGNPTSGTARTDLCFIVSNDHMWNLGDTLNANISWKFVGTADLTQRTGR